MVDHKIILGYVPVRRDMFPAQAATAMEKKIRARVKDILSQQHDVQLITIDAIVPDGILWSNACVEKIEALFRAKKVDAVFFPHCNFGQEEPVAQLAQRLNLPVLLWGPRDPAPEGESFRVFDTQCGLFATSKALTRAHVPFTYIENCWLDAPVLEEGIDQFLRVASVVKAMPAYARRPIWNAPPSVPLGKDQRKRADGEIRHRDYPHLDGRGHPGRAQAPQRQGR